VDGRKSAAAMIYSCIDVVLTLRRSSLSLLLLFYCHHVVYSFIVRGLIKLTIDRWFGMGRDIVFRVNPSPVVLLMTQHYHGAAEKMLNTTELYRTECTDLA